MDGEKTVTLKGERIAEEFQELVETLRPVEVRAAGVGLLNEPAAPDAMLAEA